jgi:hypothetical protein
MARTSQGAGLDTGKRKSVKGRGEHALHRDDASNRKLQKASERQCSMCHRASDDLKPGIGMVGKYLDFCPPCREKQAGMVHGMEALYNNPIASKHMQKWFKWDKDDICRCQIVEPETECYSGDMYVLETPEESGTMFGNATSIIHIKCGKPVRYTRDMKDWYVPRKAELELR